MIQCLYWNGWHLVVHVETFWLCKTFGYFNCLLRKILQPSIFSCLCIWLKSLQMFPQITDAFVLLIYTLNNDGSYKNKNALLEGSLIKSWQSFPQKNIVIIKAYVLFHVFTHYGFKTYLHSYVNFLLTLLLLKRYFFQELVR